MKRALDAGCDIICAQGTEAGGHTGDVSTLVLVPQCVDLAKGRTNYFGKPVAVVAAGGIMDGRGLACAMALGAAGCWCGTRFLATPEANVPDLMKELIVGAKSTDTQRTLIYSGRPMRVFRNDKVKEWDVERAEEQKKLLAQGKVPMIWEAKQRGETDTFIPPDVAVDVRGYAISVDEAGMPMGQGVGSITAITPAAEIILQMIEEAAQVLSKGASIVTQAKL